MLKVVIAYFLCISLVCIDAFSGVHEQNDLDQYILEVMAAQEHDSLLSLVRGQRSASHRNPWERSVSRTVRQAGNMQPQQCCILPKKELSEKPKMNLLACYGESRPSEIGEDELKKHAIAQGICLVECLGKKYDVLDGKGFVIKEKIMEYAKNEDDKDGDLNQSEDIITRCIDVSKKFSEERGDIKYFGKSCSMAPLMFTQCLKIFKELNCSEDMKVKNDQCDMTRMRLAEFIEIWKV